MGKEMRKIVVGDYSDCYMSLKPNSIEGMYYRNGRRLNSLRSLLNYVQGTKDMYKFDLSEVNGRVKEKLEAIIDGSETVRDKDWRAKV